MSNKSKVSNPDKPRTLDEARSRIAELNAQLGGKSPAKPAPVKQAPAGAVTSAHKAPAIASKAVSGLASMKEIQGQLDAVETPAAKAKLLESHINARRDTLKGMNHSSPEAVGLFRDLQRIEKTHAYTLRNDPALWSKVNQTPVDTDLA
jgi:hypothetical protein